MIQVFSCLSIGTKKECLKQGIATSGLPFIGNNHTYHEKLEARHRFISQPMVRDLSIINYTWCHKGVS